MQTGIEQHRVYTADQIIPKLVNIADYMIEHSNEDGGGIGNINSDHISTGNVIQNSLKLNILLSIVSILVLVIAVYYYRKKSLEKS